LTWVPFTYKQRDFDYGYLYDLMDFKLSKMIKCFKEDPYHENQNNIKWMNACRVLINRIQCDSYNIKVDKSLPLFEQMNQENELRKKDTKLLFKILSKRIDGWWT
jgi:hypothetical protein